MSRIGPHNDIPTLEHATRILQEHADQVTDNEYLRAHLHKLAYDVNQYVIRLRQQTRPVPLGRVNRNRTDFRPTVSPTPLTSGEQST